MEGADSRAERREELTEIAGIPPPPLSGAADSEVAIVAVGGPGRRGGEERGRGAEGGESSASGAKQTNERTKDDK